MSITHTLFNTHILKYQESDVKHIEGTLGHPALPSFTRFSLKRLLRIDADILPLASRMPVSMASLFRSDSVKPFKNSSSYRTREEGEREGQEGEGRQLHSFLF